MTTARITMSRATIRPCAMSRITPRRTTRNTIGILRNTMTSRPRTTRSIVTPRMPAKGPRMLHSDMTTPSGM